MRILLMIGLILVGVSLLSSTILSQDLYAASSSKNKKYEQKIDAGIKKQAGDFSNVCKVFITTKDNRSLQLAYMKSNSWECGFVNPPPPPVQKNKPPVVSVDSPIKCVIDLECQMTSKISDPDGNITLVNWIQKAGQIVNFTVSNDSQSAIFTPPINDTYKFSVEATDNNGSSTVKGIIVNVGNETTPPPPPPTCKPDEHLDNGVCVPNPKPSGNATKIDLVGDLEGNGVFNAVKNDKPDFVVALGDLFYDSNLNVYKSTFVQSFGEKQKCVIGNHDAPEDGSASIYAEAKQVCGEVWIKKLNNTAIVGFNSNGDIASQLATAKGFDFSDVKNVIIASHKPCAVFPNAHHAVEQTVKAFCDGLLPDLLGKNVYLVAGHDHNMAESADGAWFISGAGGKSHYVCDTNAIWNYCNNQAYGFLQMNIDNNSSQVTSKFIDSSGKVIH